MLNSEGRGPGVTGDRKQGKGGAKFKWASGAGVQNYSSEGLRPEDWSWGKLFHSLLRLFSAFLEGRPSPHPEAWLARGLSRFTNNCVRQ